MSEPQSNDLPTLRAVCGCYALWAFLTLIGVVHGLWTEGNPFKSGMHIIALLTLCGSIIAVSPSGSRPSKPPAPRQGKGSGLLLAILCLSIFADSDKK